MATVEDLRYLIAECHRMIEEEPITTEENLREFYARCRQIIEQAQKTRGMVDVPYDSRKKAICRLNH